MSNVSEQLQNCIAVSEKVIASTRTHGSNIAKILAWQVIAVEGPATMAAFEAVIRSFGHGLEHSTNAMHDTEQAVAAEKADDGPIRQKRDEASAELAAMIAEHKQQIAALEMRPGWNEFHPDGTRRTWVWNSPTICLISGRNWPIEMRSMVRVKTPRYTFKNPRASYLHVVRTLRGLRAIARA